MSEGEGRGLAGGRKAIMGRKAGKQADSQRVVVQDYWREMTVNTTN